MRSRLFEGYKDGRVPFGPAAGAINGNVEEEIIAKVKDVARSPAWAVAYGSITRDERIITDGVYEHDPTIGRTYNRMKLPNIGYDKAKKFVSLLKKITDEAGIPLVVSIAAGENDDPLRVVPEMTYRLAERGVDFIEVDYSCPSLRGKDGRAKPLAGYNPKALFEIDGYIKDQVDGVEIISKLPPYLNEHAALVDEVAVRHESSARRFGRTMINISNSIEGVSGPYTQKVGRGQLREFRPRVSEKVGIISNLGVNHGAEVYHRVHEQGADFTQGVTVFIENEQRGISYGETVNRIAHQYAEALALAEEAA